MRKQPVKLFEARYWRDGSSELDSFLFVSDGMRKPMDKEAQDAYRGMVGLKGGMPIEIEDVYRIDEVYDYTAKKNYKISLRAK